MSDVVKVGDNLKDIVSKLNEAQSNVYDALVIYAGVFSELSGSENTEGDYKGTATESLCAYYSFICVHLQSLAELYVKISTYINYVYEEMNNFDKELANIISEGFSKMGSGGAK